MHNIFTATANMIFLVLSTVRNSSIYANESKNKGRNIDILTTELGSTGASSYSIFVFIAIDIKFLTLTITKTKRILINFFFLSAEKQIVFADIFVR